MNRYQFIIDTIQQAAEELRNVRKSDAIVSIKDGDPKNIVTGGDVRINTLLQDMIRRTFPGESIYSEESDGGLETEQFIWTIDPIDGSSNFSRDIPHYAITLGVLEAGVPLAGAVLNPITRELFSFEKGKGAFLNSEPIAVSARTNLKEAATQFRAGRKAEFAVWGGESYTKLLLNSWKTMGFGSTALDTCFVAAGRLEASIYATFTTLDVAPALGILTEAGGIAVTKDGSPATLSREPQLVIAANNTSIADALRALLF